MSVTRADEMDTRPADNAKELLALKPGEAIGLGPSADRDLAEQFIPETMQDRAPNTTSLRKWRIPMRDAVATMGTILTEDVGGRDAVHVAVIAVTAGEKLAPSTDVSLRGETAHSGGDVIGIVDPFLKSLVMRGERFWLYLYPRTITGLRHEWTHPAFPEELAKVTNRGAVDPRAASEKWLREFCANADCPGYHEVLAAAEKVADGNNPAWNSDYLHFDGSDAHGEIPAEFWDHVSIVLGCPINGPRPSYFSCAC